MQHLTASELAAWIADCEADPSRTKPVLLDVREPWEYETCHIDGAMLINNVALLPKVAEQNSGCFTAIAPPNTVGLSPGFRCNSGCGLDCVADGDAR